MVRQLAVMVSSTMLVLACASSSKDLGKGYDPRAVLIDGRPVILVMDDVTRGPAEERESALLRLLSAYFGHSDSGKEDCMYPSPSELRRNVALVNDCGVDEHAKALVPAVARALSDENHCVRKCAIHVLECIGPSAKEARIPLMKCLSEDQEEMQGLAARAAYLITGEQQPSLMTNISLLASHDELMRQWAIESLGLMGRLAKPSLPYLERCVDDPNPKVSKCANQAIASITQDK